MRLVARLILTTGLFLAVFFASLLEARPNGQATYDNAKIVNHIILDQNNWIIYSSNYGPFVYPASWDPGGYWGGPGYSYIYGAGIWAGGLDIDDTARVAVGYNPTNGLSEFGPVNPYDWNWTNWATDSQARAYVSTNANDLANWPLRDNIGNPILKSVQDMYAVYSDENPAFTFPGEAPLKLRIKQHGYVWNAANYNDIVYFTFNAINVSGDSLKNIYFGPCFDADIGYEGGGGNDRTSFDYTRNLAIQFQTVAEPGWPMVGYFGCMFLEGPTNNTGDTVHVIDNQFSHYILPDSILGMTAFKLFTMAEDPFTDTARYKLMKGINHITNIEDAYDEQGANEPGDKRFVMSSGPFNLANGDSVKVSVCVFAADNKTALLALADTAKIFYLQMLGVMNDPAAQVFTPWPIALKNAPNPFRQQTNISYQTSKSEMVNLRVYNIAGQLVKTLVNDKQPPGSYSVRWVGNDQNGRTVAPGVYICRLQVGGKSVAKRMVLLR